MNQRFFDTPTRYFFEEGKSNLSDCIQLSLTAALSHDIQKLVIFTGVGDGVRLALEFKAAQEQFKDIEIVGVTFPSGRVSPELSVEDQRRFGEQGSQMVRGHLPFDPINGTFQERGVGQGLALLGSALETFCGSMSLCVQAVLMACDAGLVEEGEHVISLTSDTSILARACPTSKFLTQFIVREVLCKPVLLTISKKEDARLDRSDEPDIIEQSEEKTSNSRKALPPTSDPENQKQ